MVQEYSSDPLVGTLVDGRYLIQSRLASGGMSTVYVATDRRLERDVALKVLHPHMAGDPQFLDRLGREAKAAARLSHPHVVGVLDQGEDDRVAYLVMEYIKGHTLRDVLKDKGALPPRLALALIDPVVEGLGAAHDAGLIHRDIKPENVLIADDGRIKLGDFGLARAISTSTSTGALIGTVAYLSPELVLGRQADARSDIYSVGIMLYEMITGRQPFDGEVPIQVAYQHVNSTVGAPSALVPGLAAEIDELVQWCTANDPDKRPVDGNALLSELRHIRTEPQRRRTRPAAPGRASGPAGRAARRPVRRPGAPAARRIRAPRDGATEVIGGRQQPTEFITRGSNPTTVMSARPAAPRLRPAVRPGRRAVPRQATTAPRRRRRRCTAVPASKRAQRKQDRDEEKARQRAAATPVRSLREGNPRRRGLLWVLVLVIAALLAGGAGWFFGMGPGSPGTIPQLANKTVAEAQQLLRTAGFQSTTKDVFDDDVAARAGGRLRTRGRGGHPEVPAGVPRRLQGPRAVPPAGAGREVPGRGQDRPQRRGHGPGADLRNLRRIRARRHRPGAGSAQRQSGPARHPGGPHRVQGPAAHSGAGRARPGAGRRGQGASKPPG